jgi:hypothetical protein
MMPLTFRIDHDKRFVHATAKGRVVLKDVEDYFDALMVQDAMPYPARRRHARRVRGQRRRHDGARRAGQRLCRLRSARADLPGRRDRQPDRQRCAASPPGGAERAARIVGTVDEGLRWLAGQAK